MAAQVSVLPVTGPDERPAPEPVRDPVREPVTGPETRPETKRGKQRVAKPVTAGRAIAAGVWLATGLVVLFAVYLVLGSGLAADRAQSVLYQRLRTDLSQATVPVSGSIPAGTPLGVVKVPSIGLDQVFVEGSSSEETRFGPGLKTDTVLPGQAGLSVLVGHRSTSGAAFAHLNQVRPGDVIDVVTGQGRFTYVVDMVRTSDAPAAQVKVVPSRLSLVTGDPAYTPDRTLTVSARLQGKALARSTGTTAPASDQAGHGSRDRLVALLLWSQLLLATTVLVTWAAIRLPRRTGLWIGAVPVLLAILWQVFDNLAVLLPNTL